MAFNKQFSKYESDFEKFLNQMKQKNPKIEDGQRNGRALLWDKTPIDLDQRDRSEQSRVPQQAYVYQNKV